MAGDQGSSSRSTGHVHDPWGVLISIVQSNNMNKQWYNLVLVDSIAIRYKHRKERKKADKLP